MLGKQNAESTDSMIDMTYSQCKEERSVVAVLQNLYLCASMEFLMAVADFFVQALPQARPLASDMPSPLPLKQLSLPKSHGELRAGTVFINIF